MDAKGNHKENEFWRIGMNLKHIKIRLGKCSRFEPKYRNIKMYLICLTAIAVSTIVFNSFGKYAYHFLAFGFILETIVFVWLETVYYPYGVKDDEPTAAEIIENQFKHGSNQGS